MFHKTQPMTTDSPIGSGVDDSKPCQKSPKDKIDEKVIGEMHGTNTDLSMHRI